MIDMHCHLDLYPNPRDIVVECIRRKLYVLSVTTVPSAFKGTMALIPPDSRIRTALGLHPELAVTREHELPLFEQLLPQTRYVGEVGLDGSREHRVTLNRQIAVLTEILRMCSRIGGRTISLHSRGAITPLLDQLSAEITAGIFILHWFLGSSRQIERAYELGCWFSVGPAMLSSPMGMAILAKMPIDRILPESDGPFTAFEGNHMNPWNAWAILPNLARLWDISEEETKTQLMTNFKKLSNLTKMFQ